MSTAVHTMARFSAGARSRLATVVLAFAIIAIPAHARADDPVTAWNEIAARLAVTGTILNADGTRRTLAPVEQTRAMAIVHVAMHDAVNRITGTYERYSAVAPPPAGASPDAAAIAAAYHALRGIFDAETLATLPAEWATGVSPADPGLAFGQSVAEGILKLRRHDGAAEATYPYLPPNAGAAGVWAPISAAPAAQALLPGWGSVTPWVLRSGSQFRPDPPPALDSRRYARDYNEVLQVGALVGSTRTEEQTQIALFWRASPVALWNPLLRQALESRSFDLSTTARVIALFYLASADASVACWDAKYFYDYWRPQPAIVNGDADDNGGTTGHVSWAPRLPTPPHPEFPSGHTANSGAMAFVLRTIFGDAPGFVIEATSPQNAGFVRHWYTFSEGVREVIDARVYSGIHFRTADEVGARQGRQVAKFVMTHALRPATRR